MCLTGKYRWLPTVVRVFANFHTIRHRGYLSALGGPAKNITERIFRGQWYIDSTRRAVPCRVVSPWCTVPCRVLSPCHVVLDETLQQQSVGTSGLPTSIGFAVYWCVHTCIISQENFHRFRDWSHIRKLFCMTSFLFLLYYIYFTKCDRRRDRYPVVVGLGWFIASLL